MSKKKSNKPIAKSDCNSTAVKRNTMKPLAYGGGYKGLFGPEGYGIYIKHYNSNPKYSEFREPTYTFFGDMYVYAAHSKGSELIKELEGYEKRMLKQYCKKDPNAFCIMIDSLNYLGWVLYAHNGNEPDSVTDWLFNEYKRLFYTDWKDYVTEEQYCDIYWELD